MTVEYLPVGVKCNLSCTYCYQEPMRDAGNFSVPADFERVKLAIKQAGSKFALFGGEPLLTPLSHLDEVFAFGTSIGNNNGIQTNGLLVTPDHVDLFKKHRVHVGVSIDGPGLCNSARSNDFDTELIISNIRGLLSEGVQMSLILTIHALNYLHMSDLLSFVDSMEADGMRWFNFHNLEVDNCETDSTLKLSDMDNFRAFIQVYKHAKAHSDVSYFNPFNDIINLLTARNPTVSCIWSSCDPITTPAVHGIDSAGSLTNCGRTNKQGVNWLKSDSPTSLERYVALSLTSQEHGGCKDCDYFFACKGQCPGTAIDGDWRNRTKDCLFWYSLMDYIRCDLVNEGRSVLDLQESNKLFLDKLYNVQPVPWPPSSSQTTHSDLAHGDSHGDHTDHVSISSKPPNGVRPY